MPYQPVAINNPGIAPGINALSGAVEDWQKKRKEDERLQGYNDAVIQHAFDAGRISQDELNKYNAASLTQKTGIAAGYAAGLHEDLQQQQMAQQKQFHADSLANAIEVAKIHADRGPASPPAVFSLNDPQGKPFSVFTSGNNQYSLTPSSKDAPYGWEDLNKEVRAATGADLGDWQNAKNKRVEGGNVVADIVKADQWGGQVQSTIRVPQNTYKQFVSRFNQLQGGPPASDLGISREEQARKIKAQYAAKELSREESIRMLKEIGYSD